MQISEFFDIFSYNSPHMERLAESVIDADYDRAKRELLNYFVTRKRLYLSSSEPIGDADKNFPIAYISRHGILAGPNEGDVYLSSLFVTKNSECSSLDIMPFLRNTLSVMLMSRKKESEAAYFFSPCSIFPPYVSFMTKNGDETKIYPKKFAYISTKEPSSPLADEDVYEICEESASFDEAYGVSTGRVYLMFDFSSLNLSDIVSARLIAKITLPETILTKELLVFNISDHSWDNSLTWSQVKGNVYSWESSPTGPSWDEVPGSDAEYLNVVSRFSFARPMAAQYLSDVEKNAIYGEKLLFLMDAFSKKKPAGFNRVLETGERLSNFTAVLGALIDSPVMTPDYLVSILTVIYRDIKYLSENPDLGWSNWAVVRTSGLSKAIDFLPELKEYDKWRSLARKTMEHLFDKMYSPDFSFRESGFGYSFWCIELFVSAFKSAQMNNDPYSAFMRGRLEMASDAALDLMYPDFFDTNIGDSNYSDKRKYLASIAKMLPTKKLSDFIGKKPLRSVCYSYSNTAVLRSGEGDDSLYLLIQATPFDSHAHNDLNSLVFYAYGRPLITDSGRYGYSKSDISSYLRTPRAHNSVDIENAAPALHSDSSPKLELFASNSAFDFVRISAKAYSDVNSRHTRCVFLNKSEAFVIVTDFISCDEYARKFTQNWHFMPGSDADVNYDNKAETHFNKGANIRVFCPSADVAAVSDDVFSSGYGMAEEAKYVSFTKYGGSVSFSTLLLPDKEGESRHASVSDRTPKDTAFSELLLNVDGVQSVFCCKNTGEASPTAFSFDGEAAYVSGSRINLICGRKLSINKTVCIESDSIINDISLRISGGIVEVESSSLKPSTNREEAIKIYAPKTTHVLFNSVSIPFTLYSDYVYALAPKREA